MSIKIDAVITCDGCGIQIIGKSEHRATRCCDPYWSAKDRAKAAAWLTQSGGRFRVEKHFCPACADRPAATKKPVKAEGKA